MIYYKLQLFIINYNCYLCGGMTSTVGVSLCISSDVLH